MLIEMARRRRKPDRIMPTPETLAKLTPDPLFELLAGEDASLERAADEIRRVYVAVTRQLWAKGMTFGQRVPGLGELTDEIAAAHAQRYMPWVACQGPQVVDWTLNVIVDRNRPETWQADSIRRALADYARRMR